jgi:predicted transposase YdaD
MDHDRLFKELLTNFFREFVELFLPDVAEYMEPAPLEFLDKEVFTDLASSARHEVDLLVKARFRDRGEAFFLIHVENQASRQDQFAGRMFRYFARLHEKHGLPIFPIALLSYDQPVRKEPNRYRIGFPGQKVLDFEFRTVQLNRLNWRDYVRNPNPVASALMTKMRIAPRDRPRVKLECLRMMVTLKLDPARATLISAFMDSYLKLTAAEMVVYNRRVEAIEPKEREAFMEWTNEWIEKGKAQGILEGRQEGRQQERRDMLSRQLRRRLGPDAALLSETLAKLSFDQLDDLAEAFLDFKTLADVQNWLSQHAPSNQIQSD